MYEAALDQTDKNVFQFIRYEVINNSQLIKMTNISAELMDFMNSQDFSLVNGSSQNNLRRKLEGESAGSVHIS